LYLFEHHPERRLWSFGKTLWGGLSPRRFGRSLDVRQQCYPNRLRPYWFLVVLIYALIVGLPIVGLCVLDVQRITTGNQANQMGLRASLKGMVQKDPQAYGVLMRRYGSIEAYLDAAAPAHLGTRVLEQTRRDVNNYFSENWHVPVFLLLPLVWPWGILPGFRMLAHSMQRPELGPMQVRRCLVYSLDGLPWIGLVLVALTMTSLLLYRLDVAATSNQMTMLVPPTVIAYLAFSIFRLGIGLRLHLGIERAFTHVSGVHAVTFLALAIGVVVLLCCMPR
jgi:hypothetical protein